MLTITKRLPVDPGGIPVIVHLSQYDSDFTLVFELFSISDFTIPSGTTAEIRGTKSDGNGYSADATVDAGAKTVTVAGDNQITAASGKNVFEIALLKDGELLNTANFTVCVERAALDADTIQSETVLKDLDAIIEGAATATEAAQEAAASAAAAAESASTLTIDPTLTHSGQPADAKVTGDEISDLKSAFNDLDNTVGAIGTNLDTSFNISGSTVGVGTTKTLYSARAGDTIVVTLSGTFFGTSTTVYFYVFYNGDTETTNMGAMTKDVAKTITLANGIYQVAVYSNSGQTGTLSIHIENNSKSGMVAEIVDLYSKYSVSKNLATTFSNSSVDGDTGEYTELSTGVSYAATKEMIPINSSSKYMISWNEPTTKPAYAFIDEYESDGTFIKKVSFSVFEYYNYYEYTPSLDCAFVRLFLIKQNTPWAELVPSQIQFEEGSHITAYTEHYALNPLLIDPNEQYRRLVGDGTLKYDFAVPDYYFADGYLDGKVSDINTYMDSCYANGDCFVFITDAHWGAYNAKHSPALIRYLYDRTGIAKVFDGGDSANGGTPQMMEYCQTLQAAIWKEAYFAVGNHDCFGSVSTDYLSNRFDRHMQVYNGNPSQHYYYINNERAKIRYIVLACYECGDGNNAFNGIGGSSDASAAQRTWLQNVALDVDDGWAVVIIMHSLYYVSTTDPYPLVEESRYASTIEIIDDFKEGGGEVACILQGHTHIDRMTHTPGGVPVFITTCDKYYANETPPDIIVDRTPGTIREQAFDVVCINRDDQEVKLIRIGCPAQNGEDDDPGEEAEYRVMSYGD